MVAVLQGRFIILLLAVVAVLASQIIATQHIHADDETSACYVCGHADNDPAVASIQVDVLPVAANHEISLPLSADVVKTNGLNPHVRAPPKL